MNKEQIKRFMKNYGFYLAVGGISVAAITAVFLIPSTEGDVQDQPNMYATNEEAIGEDVNERVSPSYDLAFDPSILEQEIEEELSREEIIVDRESIGSEVDPVSEELVESVEVAQVEEEVETFNFSATDKIEWPVSGDVIVPFTDETTLHWFSEGLDQTMRTLGICISANEGEPIKVVAEGIIEDIVENSLEIPTLINVGDVGEVVVVDIGNGYKTLYGIQRGSVNEDQIGRHVQVGDEIGYVGEPQGPFVSEGTNVYLQMTYNDEIINPQEFLVQREQ